MPMCGDHLLSLPHIDTATGEATIVIAGDEREALDAASERLERRFDHFPFLRRRVRRMDDVAEKDKLAGRELLEGFEHARGGFAGDGRSELAAAELSPGVAEVGVGGEERARGLVPQ